MKGQVVETGRIVPQVQERPGGRRDRAIDREIAELAERQHGVVALPQLETLALRAHGRRMAAVLAVGPDAVPSHRIAEVLGRTRPTRGTKLLLRSARRTKRSHRHRQRPRGSLRGHLQTGRRPGPEVNAWMTLADGTPAKIDFLWREQWIAVETYAGPLSAHAAIQGAGREEGPATGPCRLRAGAVHRPAGRARAGLGGAHAPRT